MNSGENRKNIFIANLAEGQQINDSFLVSKKLYAETKAGKPYLALTLMDNSGEIEARVWDKAERYNSIVETGSIIRVQAITKPYREQLQLTITSLQPVSEDNIQLHHFMPASKRPANEMKKELFQVIGSVETPHLKKLLHAIFQGDLLEQFLLAPAAKKMHHAYLGGLAEHTLSVTGLAGKLSDHYPALDCDLLTAGALLHDIGKIQEFNFSAVPFDYTDPGRLIGHLVLGSEMVRKEAVHIDDFPEGILDQLIHLILSHHGRHEFGSPCLPMTMEAILLHHLDDIDAKMNYIEKLSDKLKGNDYQWSDYQRPLERFLLLKGHGEADEEQTGSQTTPVISREDGGHKRRKKIAPNKPRQTPLF